MSFGYNLFTLQSPWRYLWQKSVPKRISLFLTVVQQGLKERITFWLLKGCERLLLSQCDGNRLSKVVWKCDLIILKCASYWGLKKKSVKRLNAINPPYHGEGTPLYRPTAGLHASVDNPLRPVVHPVFSPPLSPLPSLYFIRLSMRLWEAVSKALPKSIKTISSTFFSSTQSAVSSQNAISLVKHDFPS